MSEPQIWTLIGVFGATMVGLVAIVTQLMSAKFERVHERIDGLKTEMVLRFERIDERVDEGFSRVDQRLGKLETRVDHIDARLEGLDRDVQVLTKRAFPIGG